MELIPLLALGFFLGLKHSLDADHVVAVSTIASQTKSFKKSSMIGVVWGIGHTTVLLLAGLIILGLKLTIPDKVSMFFELLVGIVLVLLGADVLRKVIKEKIHIHKHKHDSIEHIHFHSHKKSSLHSHSHKPFLVGMIHGLAGSAALTLLILSTAKSIFQGMLFVLIFGIGSILGMLAISSLIAVPFLFTQNFRRINNSVKIIAGLASILLGITIIYELAFASGLLF